MSECCSKGAPPGERPASDSSGRVSRRPRCPLCGLAGRPVSARTVRSLVRPEIAESLWDFGGFFYCDSPGCDAVYFCPGGDRVLGRSALKVRVGRKESAPPRPICYCFGFTYEDIEAEVEATGQSAIVGEITDRCRKGLDRCEETNPRGACCLGEVRAAVAQALKRKGQAEHSASRGEVRLGVLAQVGAIAAAVLASACCWLPLALVAAGASVGTLAGRLEAWRPVFLPATFVFLAAAFYFAYRRPATDGQGACGEAGACCPESSTKARSARRLLLWVVAALAVGFALFPEFGPALLGSNLDSAAATSGAGGGPGSKARVFVLTIEGMTCPVCAATIEKSLRGAEGVSSAEVDYESGQARVVARARVRREDLRAAVEKAGYRLAALREQAR